MSSILGIHLSNNVTIPSIGYGTYKLQDYKHTVDTVTLALECGYRLIDTAPVYENEEAIGDVLKVWLANKSNSRDEIFISSKVSNEDQGYHNTLNAFERTINNLQLDKLDLYLIHWPVPRYKENCYKELNCETWLAMQELYKSGKVKAIGVSNFLQRHLESLLSGASISPMVNQLEIHPRYQQKDLVQYCQDNDILVEAWGPFRSGLMLEDELLSSIASKYKKTIPQICIKWNLQRGIVPLPKSSNVNRMKENLDVFDFTISEEDMLSLARLDTDTCHADFYNYVRQQQF